MAQSNEWLNNIQWTAEGPVSYSDKFYLTPEQATAEDELQATIRLFEESPGEICRFPARLLLLQTHLNRFTEIDPKQQCKGYAEFLNKAPIDSVSLVYASENVTQASSMMGHIMLKISGVNSSGLHVEHGVTFFTELEGFNIPKILWQSLVTGKPGFFQVAPYEPFLNHYLGTEARSIYEYPLTLSHWQRSLLAARVWELGENNFDYFFHTYNCATVTKVLLASVAPELTLHLDEWLTPIDVVKAAADSNLIQSASISTTNEWKLRFLKRVLSHQYIAPIDQAIKNQQLPEFNDKDTKLAALGYHYYKQSVNFLINEGKLSSGSGLTLLQETATKYSQFEDTHLEIGGYKNPLNTPNDSQLTVGFESTDEQFSTTLRYFPVANSLTDDNREFYGENVLLLADTILRISDTGSVKLDQMMLYQMRTVVDYDEQLGGISSLFEVGFRREFDQNGRRKLHLQVKGGIGLANVVSTQFGSFMFLNLEAGGSPDNQYVALQPELGIYAYLTDNSKTVITYDAKFYSDTRDKVEHHVSGQHIVFVSNSVAINTGVKYIKNSWLEETKATLSLSYNF
ncbi:DUF4105 domain-containing protein [Alteromonas facilis]|uniref:lipoprotein N-acyltransferase Lnb domain-containing protein n=1 Tax=Alteromonas facilis TaxID=2048004 RepID=UPI0013DB25CB|nr:DUF4105 domain-containing protein [Alteromonas facilis]